MLKPVVTTSFKKDYKKIIKQDKNIKKLENIIFQLSNKMPLDKKFRDHQLTGNYNNRRELHISPDWLLIYAIKGSDLILYRTGSHSELFNK